MLSESCLGVTGHASRINCKIMIGFSGSTRSHMTSPFNRNSTDDCEKIIPEDPLLLITRIFGKNRTRLEKKKPIYRMTDVKPKRSVG